MNSIIRCESLSKVYENGRGLHNIDLEIPSGKVVGLLGSNGSGKSTLLKLINGMLVPTNGRILVNEMMPSKETKKIVSYLPERNSLNTWMKVKELVRFYQDFYEDFNVQKAIRCIQDLEIDMNAKLKTLSKGNREKISLVLAMSRNALLYSLDEPIGGVDPAAREYIIETILNNFNKSATLLISTHMIADIEPILDYCVFVKDGTIIQSIDADEIRKTGITIDEYFRRMYRDAKKVN